MHHLMSIIAMDAVRFCARTIHCQSGHGDVCDCSLLRGDSNCFALMAESCREDSESEKVSLQSQKRRPATSLPSQIKTLQIYTNHVDELCRFQNGKFGEKRWVCKYEDKNKLSTCASFHIYYHTYNTTAVHWGPWLGARGGSWWDSLHSPAGWVWAPQDPVTLYPTRQCH